MSQENVELTYKAVDAFNRRDIDAILALSHPDMEHVALGGETYRGHDDVRAWWEETFSGIGDVFVEAQGVRDFGDTVLLAARLRGHGTSSRVPFDQSIWTVHRWSEGQMVRWTSHLHEPEALAAVGLSE